MQQESGVKFTLEEVRSEPVSIKVVGIGGCGGNIVDYMIESGIQGVEFVVVNTDEHALGQCNAPTKILLGPRVTQGRGTGANPEVGREAALESTEELSEIFAGADMVFLTVGLGGGTGSGAAPVLGSLAKQIGALTIAVAIKPFGFEGKKRAVNAAKAASDLLGQVDTVVIIPNDRLLKKLNHGTGFFDGFVLGNEVATETLLGVTSVLNETGVMNCDFADLRAVFEGSGLAVVSSSRASGRDAAVQAARAVIDHQSMEHDGLSKAGRVLVNVTGSGQFGLHDANEALSAITKEIGSGAELTVGVVRDDSLGEDVRVLMIASQFSGEGFGQEADDNGGLERSGFGGREFPWQSQSVDEPGQSDEQDGPPENGAESFEIQPDEADTGAHDVGQPDPAGVDPSDPMPPPKVRISEDPDDGSDDPTLRKQSLFRRKSFFR